MDIANNKRPLEEEEEEYAWKRTKEDPHVPGSILDIKEALEVSLYWKVGLPIELVQIISKYHSCDYCEDEEHYWLDCSWEGRVYIDDNVSFAREWFTHAVDLIPLKHELTSYWQGRLLYIHIFTPVDTDYRIGIEIVSSYYERDSRIDEDGDMPFHPIEIMYYVSADACWKELDIPAMWSLIETNIRNFKLN